MENALVSKFKNVCVGQIPMYDEYGMSMFTAPSNFMELMDPPGRWIASPIHFKCPGSKCGKCIDLI